MDNSKRKVVLITDGDDVARKTVETAAKNVGGCCISASAGNPTPLRGEEIVKLIKGARVDPVLVMLDDKGCRQKGKGERALEYIARHPDVDVLGVIAVASNTRHTKGVRIKESVALNGELAEGPVDKEGIPEPPGHKILEGDTVSVLASLKFPVVIGIGDIGKMNGHDRFEKGAELTTKAVKYVLQRSGYRTNGS